MYSHKKHNDNSTALAKRTNDFELLELEIEGMDVITKIEKRAVDSKLRPIEAVIIKRIREIDAPQN